LGDDFLKEEVFFLEEGDLGEEFFIRGSEY
jgi:hypothetical protein